MIDLALEFLQFIDVESLAWLKQTQQKLQAVQPVDTQEIVADEMWSFPVLDLG